MLGDRIAGGMPVRIARGIVAVIFAILGVTAPLGVGERLSFQANGDTK
jgi:putative Ca2+/H+ antiporter (TMEM165/GDT1 family)